MFLPAGPWIQLSYSNRFRSVWEYEEAIKSKKIDWRSEIGLVCPVCGVACGYREIDPYHREARELWPPRSGMVPVARFQCRGTAGKYPTFSMLPYQLVPYHRYTLSSMIQAVLLWWEYWKDPGESGTAYRAEQSLPGESRVTAWQLVCWLLSFRRWLLGAQWELVGRYDFSGVPFGESVLEEVHGYFEALSRGPPGRGKAVVSCVREHAEGKGRFMFGVPSQGR